jgi:excisionase family DNA binding protein
MTRDLSDPNDTWWTIDQAAEHFGIRRESILRYIREGMPAYGPRGHKLIRRADVLAEYRRRKRSDLSRRAKPA